MIRDLLLVWVSGMLCTYVLMDAVMLPKDRHIALLLAFIWPLFILKVMFR